jgi:hypothetical protein
MKGRGVVVVEDECHRITMEVLVVKEEEEEGVNYGSWIVGHSVPSWPGIRGND